MYGVEGGFPMFFDTDGRGSDIYPTGKIYFVVLLVIIQLLN